MSLQFGSAVHMRWGQIPFFGKLDLCGSPNKLILLRKSSMKYGKSRQKPPLPSTKLSFQHLRPPRLRRVDYKLTVADLSPLYWLSKSSRKAPYLSLCKGPKTIQTQGRGPALALLHASPSASATRDATNNPHLSRCIRSHANDHD